MHDDDRAMRDQLRAVDSAGALPPVSPTWLDHRMEQIMTEQSSSTPTATLVPSRPRFRPWMALVGVAAALVTAAAITVPIVLGGTQQTVETLQPTQGGPAGVSCIQLTPETVALQDQAFAATVLRVDGTKAVLEVTERFAGDVADRVEVTQSTGGDPDLSSVPFELGKDYLVGASGGRVSGCGITGLDTPELRAIYVAAFPG